MHTLKKSIYCLLLLVALVPSMVLSQMAKTGSSGGKALDESMQAVLSDYLKVQKSLASDSTEGVWEAAKKIVDLAVKLEKVKVSDGDNAKHYAGLAEKIKVSAQKLATAADIKQARANFKELSKPMALWASVAKPKEVIVVYCSMAPGSWLQKKGAIRNPYYGASMLECGDVVSSK